MTRTEQGVDAAGAPGDEQCMLELAQNKPEALKPLFARYAPMVFHMATQSLDPGTAEEIVQDVLHSSCSLWVLKRYCRFSSGLSAAILKHYSLAPFNYSSPSALHTPIAGICPRASAGDASHSMDAGGF